MNLIYNVESWIKDHWIILIISIISVIIITLSLTILVIWIMKKIKQHKPDKKIRKIWKNKEFSETNLIDTFMINSLNIKFGQIEIKKINDNKKIAWYTLIDIWTRVIANKYDEDYGNPKEALDSLYSFYKELRTEIKKYPSAFKSNIVILAFMNNELRPFLTKWNSLINEKYKDLNKNEYIDEFITDFNSMYDSILQNKYIENLLLILGLNINHKNITIPDGVENLKKINLTEKSKDNTKPLEILLKNSALNKQVEKSEID